MRAVVTIAGVAIFSVGFAWRVVGWILTWVGWALGVRGIASSYEAFVEGYVGKLLADGSLVRIFGPWLLMAAGLLLLAAVHWVSREPSQTR